MEEGRKENYKIILSESNHQLLFKKMHKIQKEKMDPNNDRKKK